MTEIIKVNPARTRIIVRTPGPQGPPGSGGGDLDPDLTAIAALTPSNDDIIQRKAGAWTNRTIAQLKTDLNYTASDVGAQPSDSDLTAIAGLSPSNDDIIQRKAGAWTNRTIAQLKTDLNYTASGLGALVAANNLSDVASAATSRSNLGLGTAAVTNTGTGDTNTILGNDARLTDARTPTAHAASHADGGSDEITVTEDQVTNLVTDLAGKQPLDSDLTAIAALAPVNDDIIQRKAGAWTNRTIAQLKTDLNYTASDVGAQPSDSDLTAIAGLSPSNDDIIQRKAGAWTNRTIAQLKTDLNYTASDVGAQPSDSDLTAIAGLSPSNDDIIQRKAGAWTNRTIAQYKSDLNINPFAFIHVDTSVTAWYRGTTSFSTSTDITSGAVKFIPFFPDRPCTMTRFAYQIVRQSVAAAGTDQLGVAIYGCTGTYTGEPTGSPLVDFGLFDLEQATGVYVVDPSNYSHPGTLLWWGVGRITSGTVTTSGRVSSSSFDPSISVLREVASSPASNIGSSLSGYAMSGWAGGAMPTVGALSTETGNQPIILPELTA